MKVSKKIVGVQASFFFGLIFLVVITPLATVLKIVNPHLFYGSGFSFRKNSYWNKIPTKTYDLNSARKQ